MGLVFVKIVYVPLLNILNINLFGINTMTYVAVEVSIMRCISLFFVVSITLSFFFVVDSVIIGVVLLSTILMISVGVVVNGFPLARLIVDFKIEVLINVSIVDQCKHCSWTSCDDWHSSCFDYSWCHYSFFLGWL